MPRSRTLVGTLVLMLALGPPIASAATARTPDEVTVAGPTRVAIEIVLPSRGDGFDRAEVARAQAELLASLPAATVTDVHRFATVPFLSAMVSNPQALARLRANPRVRRVDPTAGGEGHLADVTAIIDADTAFVGGLTGAGVTVAVIDSGIDPTHPDLADDVVAGAQACFGANGPTGFCPNGTSRQFGPGAADDDAGHGTHVSGIVTSTGIVSSRGVAPDADIIAIKALDDCSFSGCFYDALEIVAALDYIAANPQFGIDVVNLSLGTGLKFPAECDEATAWTAAGAAVVEALRSQGVLTVASAGNSAGSSMGFPACLDQVVSVGASTDDDQPASFTASNAGTDVFAPGVDVVSAAIGGGTISVSGTSMAAPATSACAALLLQSGAYPTPDELEARLETSAVSIVRNGLTFPRIDCYPAIPGTCNGLSATVDLGRGESPTPGDDVILGTAGDDTIVALDGDDVICAGGGDDHIVGGDGDDVIFGEAGNDTISGNAGDDDLFGLGGGDTMFGGSGDDELDGGAGDDILGGSSGHDRIAGGPGNDRITGGSDPDFRIDGGAGNDAVNGGGGTDAEVRGGDGNDTVSGNGGDDLVYGDDGDDDVRGGPGDDEVFGGAGDDFVAGNRGHDVCDGGSHVLGDVAREGNCEVVLAVP